MVINIIKKLESNIILEIEEFLLKNSSTFNPLFSTPLWAERLKNILSFEYEYLIIKENQNIIALQLIFNGYRGYAKINKLPFLLQDIGKFYAKQFYSYLNWYNFLVIKNNLIEEKQKECKKLIYDYINLKNIKINNSPIYENDEIYFKNKNVSNWGTYILDISDKAYEEVYQNFKRQARKSIEKTLFDGVYVKELEVDEVDIYSKWLIENQKETSKTYKIDSKLMKKEFNRFNNSNYIYKIFVAYKDDMILGSLGIWGFGNYISEFGVYQSSFARENKLYVQDVIKKSIVEFMYQNDIKYFDLAGFNPSEFTNSKEKAIKQFKEKFRGNELIYKNVGN